MVSVYAQPVRALASHLPARVAPVWAHARGAGPAAARADHTEACAPQRDAGPGLGRHVRLAHGAVHERVPVVLRALSKHEAPEDHDAAARLALQDTCITTSSGAPPRRVSTPGRA
jgi:hypothetical protein